MKLPSESSSSNTHVGFAVFTWASLRAWSEMDDLAEADRRFLGEQAVALRTYIDDLVREARETEDVVTSSRPLALAQRNVALFVLKRRVSSALNRVVDGLAMGSKDHHAVRHFLPNLLATVFGARIADRPALAEDAAGRLAAGEGELGDRDTLVSRIRAAAAAAQVGITSSAAAWSGWRTERSEEVLAKAKLRIELERTHRSLGARFPGQRAFVESFFLKGTRPSEGADEDAEPAAEAEPTSPG